MPESKWQEKINIQNFFFLPQQDMRSGVSTHREQQDALKGLFGEKAFKPREVVLIKHLTFSVLLQNLEDM